ncbi:MAG: hypothetical protein ACQKBU_02410, partial [Verrucomicrobiales bacterium]
MMMLMSFFLVSATTGLGQALDGESGRIVRKSERKVPLVYSASANMRLEVNRDEIHATMKLDFEVHQGRPEKLSVALSGDGKVTAVTGASLKSWSVRAESDGSRYLDLYPELPEPKPLLWEPPIPFWSVSGWDYRPFAQGVDEDHELPSRFAFSVEASDSIVHRDRVSFLVPGPGGSTGFESVVTLQEAQGTKVAFQRIEGLYQEDGFVNGMRFRGTRAARLEARVLPVGAGREPIRFIEPKLRGRLGNDGRSVEFSLEGRVEISEQGASLELLKGVALEGAIAGNGWRVQLVKKGDEWVHELVGDSVIEEGDPLRLRFYVPVEQRGDWKQFAFSLPAGVAVPVVLDGLSEEISFAPDEALRPERVEGSWV